MKNIDVGYNYVSLILACALAGVIAFIVSQTGILTAHPLYFFKYFIQLYILLILVEIPIILAKHENTKVKTAIALCGVTLGLFAIFLLNSSKFNSVNSIYSGDILINKSIVEGALIGLLIGAVKKNPRMAVYGFLMGAITGSSSIWFGEINVYIYIAFFAGIIYGIAERSILKAVSCSLSAGVACFAGILLLKLTSLFVGAKYLFVLPLAGMGAGVAFSENVNSWLQDRKDQIKIVAKYSGAAALLAALFIFISAPYGFVIITSTAGAVIGFQRGLYERSFRKAAYGILLGAFGGASWVWFAEKNASAYIGLCLGIGIGVAEDSLLAATYFAFLGAVGGFLGMSLSNVLEWKIYDSANFVFPTVGIGAGLSAAKYIITKFPKEKLIHITGILIFVLAIFVSFTVPDIISSSLVNTRSVFSKWIINKKGESAKILNARARAFYGEIKETIINQRKHSYGSDLTKAAGRGHKQIVEILLTQSKTLTQADKNLALIEAVKTGNLEIADLLISFGADVNTRNAGKSVLSFACENASKDMAQLLVRRGAQINCEGKTPLICAAENGDKETAGFLVSSGADINKKYLGETALMAAAAGGKKEVLEFLLSKNADLTPVNRYSEDAFLLAVANNQKETAAALLAKGVNIERPDRFGQTALIIAAFYGYSDMTDFLLSKGANVNAADEEGNTALKYAQIKGFEDIAAKLTRGITR